MSLQNLVFTALDNAVENGHDPRDQSDEQNAADLGTYDSELEGREVSELLPFIRAWRAAR